MTREKIKEFIDTIPYYSEEFTLEERLQAFINFQVFAMDFIGISFPIDPEKELELIDLRADEVITVKLEKADFVDGKEQ